MRHVLVVFVLVLFCTQAIAQPPVLAPSELPTNLEWVEKDNKWGLFNFKSKKYIINPKFEEAEFYGMDVSMVKQDGKYGLVDHDGELLTDFVYDTTVNFSYSLILAQQDKKFVFIIKDNLNTDNMGFAAKFTLDKEYDQVLMSYLDNYAVVELGGKFGYIDQDGNEVIDLKYEGATLFDDGIAAVKKDNKWGAINKEDEVVIEFQYAIMSSYQEGFAIAKNDDGQWGMIDRSNNAYFKFAYEYLTPMNDEGVAIAKKNGMYGLLDQSGEAIVNFEYEFNENYSGLLTICEGYMWFQKDGKWGTVDHGGEVIIPFKFDKLYSTDGEEARVWLGEKMMIVDVQGKCVQNCE